MLAGAWGCGAWGCAGKAEPRIGPASLGERVQAPGVEVEWWVVDDFAEPGKPGLASVLAELSARPVPVPWAALEVWGANGLRVLSATPEEVESARGGGRLRFVGPLQTQWVAEAATWSDLARSDAGQSLALRMDDGGLVVREGAGRLALSLRCWLSPDPVRIEPEGGGSVLEHIPAALVVEMVPRHLPGRDARPALSLSEGELPSARPLMFERLRLSAVLRGEEVLLIVPAEPGEEWDAGNPSVPLVPRMGAQRGPQAAPAVTLGDALLGRSGGARPGRTIIVIHASAQRSQRLLAD